MKRILIDTDTGSDDAVALVMALRDKALQVEAITTVAGNVNVDLATKNALMSIDFADTYAPPVYRGAPKPMVHEHWDAAGVHGEDGMGDLGTLPEPKGKAQDKNAVDAIIDFALVTPEAEILALGPLTNLALAMLKNPDAMKQVKQITLMGGAVYRGNTGPLAEFNIWEDAEAADIVFTFGVPIVMVPIEACRGDAAILEEDVNEIKSWGSKCADFCMDCNRTLYEGSAKFAGFKYFTLPDATAVVPLTRPDLITKQYGSYTRVETRGKLTYGATINDVRDRGRKEFLSKTTVLYPFNCTIVESLDAKGFKDYLKDLIK